MTVTIDLSPEREAVLKAQARGLTIEQCLLELADQHALAASVAHLQKMNPGEWARHFDAWVNSHDPNTPVLPDEAMSRDSIYPDRLNAACLSIPARSSGRCSHSIRNWNSPAAQLRP